MKKNILILIIILFFFEISAQTPINHTYPTNDGPDKNPLKGWNSGWWDDFDMASVGFQYLKWNEFEPTDNNFDFSKVEEVLNRPGSSGRHIILRLYTDWFGANQTSDAGPEWLYSNYGVERLQAPNGKYITNYNHPNYIAQVTEAIEALANQYNNDPRLYIIQLGVLGYWGEWHTYSYNDSDFEIGESTKNQIISAYKANFSSVELMGRYPWREPLSNDGEIGFHNDFFVPNNGHSDEFDDAILAGNKWLNGPIGGEVPPIDDSEQFMTDLYETPTGINMITTGHYSTMKVGNDERPCISNPDGSKCDGFMAMHRKMGYNYQITSAEFAENLSQSDNISINLNIMNIGVAPMYYDWNIQFALLNTFNEAVEFFDVSYDLRTMLPSENAYTISTSNSLNSIDEGEYKLALRLIQPNADADKPSSWRLDARNTYILFSNDIPVIDGEWGANNDLKGGWSILGDISIENSTLSTDDPSLNNNISVYPNPSKSVLNIVKNTSIVLNDIKLHDITGRIVKSVAVNNVQEAIILDVSTLASGIYNLVITSDSGDIKKRFVKQ